VRLAAHRIPGLLLVDHEFEVPLDHAAPAGEKIRVFARELVAADKLDAQQPLLLFLQGGPGFPSPRPAERAGWIKRALADYHVLLLDQRGTGRSTPIVHDTLGRAARSASGLADYLRHFRADAIVADCELIREELWGGKPWSVLGQSYGGFCIAHYLSARPDALSEVFITGGLPPLATGVDDVYRATYRRLLERNRLYFERYPGDAARVREIVGHLLQRDVRLPGGGRLTARRFQQLGLELGMSDGFETLHYLLELTGPGGEPGYSFLRAVEERQSFDRNPIYAVLHEAIYCEGTASRWSAERVLREFPELAVRPGEPVLFTGEMIYPFMFEEYEYLRPFREAAEILAEWDGWPALYDPERLGANTVPAVASVYHDDMYVDRELSLATASRVAGLRVWITNELQHNGLRAEGERVLDRLIRMRRGEI
jgi:pimeloyl-ACP methyl ester carboxylesterase